MKQLKALQQMADVSPQTQKLRAFQAMASKSVIQKEATETDSIIEIKDVEKDSHLSSDDEEQDKLSTKEVKVIENSCNKSGFITEKASLRKTDVVNSIIESNKKDKKNAAKIIKSGSLPKDKGWFGLGHLGVRTEKFELSDNFDPKKLKYLIPVKIDQVNEDKEIGWTPVQINYDFNDTAKKN